MRAAIMKTKILLTFLVILLPTTRANAWECFEFKMRNGSPATTCTAKCPSEFFCWHQRKASCFNFYDAMDDRQSQWCSASPGDCEYIREMYQRTAKGAGFSNITQCGLVKG